MRWKTYLKGRGTFLFLVFACDFGCALAEELVEAAGVGEHEVAEEKQERADCDRAAKVQGLDQILSNALLPDDEEGEQGDPGNEHQDADDLTLLGWIRIIRGMAHDGDRDDE